MTHSELIAIRKVVEGALKNCGCRKKSHASLINPLTAFLEFEMGNGERLEVLLRPVKRNVVRLPVRQQAEAAERVVE